ncbi:MAG TPA: hypothetical protein DGT21_22805 [Armatimonadetes bacterium]|jgi:ribokinase|nr:hypothetical protein [Armatimonadota bacterium]
MKPTWDVCALGCVCWDTVGTVTEYPGPDEKASLGALVQQGGGRAGTAAAAVAALGGSVRIFGRLGDDDFGTQIVAEFARQNVDTGGLDIVAGESSQYAFCVAHEQTGQRMIFYKHGSAERLTADDVDLDALTDCRCLLVDSHHPGAAIAAAQTARERGVPVVLDAERPQDELGELLACIDYMVLPRSLVEQLGDGDEARGIAELMGHSPKALVITRGAAGCDVHTADGHFHQPAFTVPKVIDTTGAGDVFHGAFAYFVSQEYSLAETVAFASATAALSTTALGGRGHLPSLSEVKSLVYGLGSTCSN